MGEVQDMEHIKGRREVHTGFWWGKRGKRPLEQPRCRWEDNIKLALQDIDGGSMDWIDLAQDRAIW